MSILSDCATCLDYITVNPGPFNLYSILAYRLNLFIEQSRSYGKSFYNSGKAILMDKRACFTEALLRKVTGTQHIQIKN